MTDQEMNAMMLAILQELSSSINKLRNSNADDHKKIFTELDALKLVLIEHN